MMLPFLIVGEYPQVLGKSRVFGNAMASDPAEESIPTFSIPRIGHPTASWR